jgi:V/A-type H+-transporting ATPase subunit D
MVDLRRIPPGRAGRLWLTGRLRSARLATDLLERKLRILRLERERFDLRADRTGRRWGTSWRTADRWGTRAAVLGGHRAALLCAPAGRATVEVAWANAMGVRYPAEAVCRLPVAAVGDPVAGTVTIVEATEAYRAAVVAAVAHAAAEAARRAVDAELAATGRRRRAIADRLLPGLEAALASVTADLEETERAETVRLRWAAAGGRAGGNQ